MYQNLQFTYWCKLYYIIIVKKAKAKAKAKVKNKEFDYSLYKTPFFRPGRDRMIIGRHFNA